MYKVVIEFLVDDYEEAFDLVDSLNHKSDCHEALADLARTDFEFSAKVMSDVN